MMHQVLHQRCPIYVSVRPRRVQLSRHSAAFHNHQSRTQFGRRAFVVYGPDIWNTLPPVIRTIDQLPGCFPAFAKTHYIYFILLLTSSYSCFSQTWLRYTHGKSVCHLSVVCDVRAPYTPGGLTFRGWYFCTIVAWPSGNSPTIFHEDRPRGSPLPANLPNRRVAMRLL